MGKVQFPLVNIRKDITNKWHIHHIESEILAIPDSPDEYGFYTVSFGEIPDNGSSPGAFPPKIAGFTEYKGNPVNSKTGRLNLSSGQFYVNYSTGQALFHPSMSGVNVSVDYYAKGSLVEAEEVNWLYGKIRNIEADQFAPEFTSFSISNMPKTVEIGQLFPVGSRTPVSTIFQWNVDKTDLLESNSIKITMGDQLIGSGIPPSAGSIDISVSQQRTSEVPSKLEFGITAQTATENEISSTYSVEFVDRIFYGTAQSKIASSQFTRTLESVLLESSDPRQEVDIYIPSEENAFKIISVPMRYAIKKIIDSKTGLEFILDDPVQINILNRNGVTIPYYTYFTTYKISSAVNLRMELGA